MEKPSEEILEKLEGLKKDFKGARDHILFKHESGELMFMRRSAITSYHPKYQLGLKSYIIYCSDGVVEKPLYKTSTIEEAEIWCYEQLLANEKLDVLEKKKAA